MATPCHIIVEGNPAILYASRNGTPAKVLPRLNKFLDIFSEERETAGEYCDTPECLLAQVVVRFGFEICEDDFSNLRVGIHYHPDVEYLYSIASDYSVTIWQAEAQYRQNPSQGLQACRQVASEVMAENAKVTGLRASDR